ncbi:MAG: heavy metal-responsive transcriptional regulator [Cyanobacteria bacterium J06639_1]
MQASSSHLVRIGQVARRSGLAVKTIRYYADLHLLRTEHRTSGGFRLFDLDDTLMRLAFIKRAQGLGLSLHDIGNFLQVRDRGELPCAEIHASLQQKLHEIDRKLEQLTTLRAELRGLLSGWQEIPHPRSGTICPILEREICADVPTADVAPR